MDVSYYNTTIFERNNYLCLVGDGTAVVALLLQRRSIEVLTASLVVTHYVFGVAIDRRTRHGRIQ